MTARAPREDGAGRKLGRECGQVEARFTRVAGAGLPAATSDRGSQRGGRPQRWLGRAGAGPGGPDVRPAPEPLQGHSMQWGEARDEIGGPVRDSDYLQLRGRDGDF